MSDELTKFRATCDVDGWKGPIRNLSEEAVKDVDKHNKANEGHTASVEEINTHHKNIQTHEGF